MLGDAGKNLEGAVKMRKIWVASQLSHLHFCEPEQVTYLSELMHK